MKRRFLDPTITSYVKVCLAIDVVLLIVRYFQ